MAAPGRKEWPIIFSSWQLQPLFPFLAMAYITNMLFIGCWMLSLTSDNSDLHQCIRNQARYFAHRNTKVQLTESPTSEHAMLEATPFPAYGLGQFKDNAIGTMHKLRFLLPITKVFDTVPAFCSNIMCLLSLLFSSSSSSTISMFIIAPAMMPHRAHGMINNGSEDQAQQPHFKSSDCNGLTVQPQMTLYIMEAPPPFVQASTRYADPRPTKVKILQLPEAAQIPIINCRITIQHYVG